MALIYFIAKGKVDGQEYNKGNTLDVDEATKSRLLKEGCIKSDGGASDCSELKKALEDKDKELKKALEDKDKILESLSQAEKISDFKAIKEKYNDKGE